MTTCNWNSSDWADLQMKALGHCGYRTEKHCGEFLPNLVTQAKAKSLLHRSLLGPRDNIAEELDRPRRRSMRRGWTPRLECEAFRAIIERKDIILHRKE